MIFSRSSILIYKGFLIYVIDNQIQVTIIVQIAIGHAVGKTGLGYTRWIRYILKIQIAIIFKQIIRYSLRRYFFWFIQQYLWRCKGQSFIYIIEKITVIYVPSCTVGYKYILFGIIIHVQRQYGPAPICRWYSSYMRYVAKLRDTIFNTRIQL